MRIHILRWKDIGAFDGTNRMVAYSRLEDAAKHARELRLSRDADIVIQDDALAIDTAEVKTKTDLINLINRL